MSNDGPGFLDWVLDLIAFQGTNTKEMPPLEATDGQEPTAESLRAQARQADARPPSTAAKTLTATDKKVLDKEFWETM